MLNNTAERLDTLKSNPTRTTQSQITFQKELSDGAKVLGLILLDASGSKGFCWHRISTLCDLAGKSRSAIKRYLRELAEQKIIRIHRRPGFHTFRGHSNVYELLIITKETTDYGSFLNSRTIRTKKTYERANVIDLRSPEQPKPQTHEQEHTPDDPRSVPVGELNIEPRGLQSTVNPSIVISPTETQDHVSKPKTRGKPVQHYLIREILNLTNDKKSFGLWYKFVSKCDEQTVYRCLDCLRTAIDCDQVNHRGRYLVGIMKQICPELFQGTPSNYQPPAPKPEPTVTRDEALNKAGLADIKAILFSKKSPEGPDANRLNQTRTARVFELSNG